MIRGTTPTFVFTLPFTCTEFTVCNIAFAQAGKVVLEKELSDCNITGKKITVTLSEVETLMFDCNKGIVEIQIRGGIGATRIASEIMTTSVRRILKEGCLYGS